MYNTTRKKNPSSAEVMADMRKIGRMHHVYLKDADPDSDYFVDHIIRKIPSWYYRTRLKALAYDYRRALKSEEAQNWSKGKLKVI